MDLSVRFPKSPSRASARRYRVGGERITVVIVPIDRDQNSTLEKIEELKLVLSRDPGSHVYVELAQLYIQMEDLVSARGVVLDGLSRDQRHVPGQMKLAEVDFALGFYDKPSRPCEKSFRRDRRIVQQHCCWSTDQHRAAVRSRDASAA